MARYSHEIVHEIWNDDTGERLVVKVDPDTGTLVEIQSQDSNGKALQVLNCTPEQVPFLLTAITAVAGYIQENEKKEKEKKNGDQAV